ncbi:TPA: hypothetical protein N5K73_001507 [Enterobacter kobei]|nr:hypothetical protein [Enterobacter kobei]HCM9165449.1 hypothetical protein [Enterobacter kobei]HDC4589283.1 hypothetical protein [Enterobacter cloacae]
MKKGKFDNTKKGGFLDTLAIYSLDNGTITDRCKFNFSYFDNSQEAGQDFNDWTHPELVKLLEKLKNYSTASLDYWRNKRAGGGGLKILEIYGGFPKRSTFTHPKHVPHDVQWARFRMENLARLVGFVVPKGIKCADGVVLKEPFDCNTFYVVFLDKEHKFYVTEER